MTLVSCAATTYYLNRRSQSIQAQLIQTRTGKILQRSINASISWWTPSGCGHRGLTPLWVRLARPYGVANEPGLLVHLRYQLVRDDADPRTIEVGCALVYTAGHAHDIIDQDFRRREPPYRLITAMPP